ncbi:phosphate ABC transporter substrate-binding protein PstS [Gordonia hirsuta]|uniref:phosphate ABC transporter substrate-binding protein PstS n=1 Tax=Gordonia hirsuta TaxID=53427 RepID=UPI000462CC29
MGVRSVSALSAALAAGLLLTACGSGSGPVITGEGSTAQQKAMTHFADVLTDDGGAVLDYTGSGSGAGIKKFLSGDVDFAGTDSPLSAQEATAATERCNGNPAWHLPLVVGPVAIAYHLPGVSDLTLNAPVLAKIFDSKIDRWNDPEIAALNPGVTLPDTPVVPVHRSDSSGTTDNFTRYLRGAAPAQWPYQPSKEWAGAGGSGAAKSTGVGDTVKKTPGAVTYVEWGFATENQLGVARLDFGAGPTELTARSAAAALENITFAEPGSKDLVVDTDALYAQTEKGAYPLLLTPYSVVCSAGYTEAGLAEAMKSSFTTILDRGQDGLTELGFVPLPQGYAQTLRGTIDAL